MMLSTQRTCRKLRRYRENTRCVLRAGAESLCVYGVLTEAPCNKRFISSLHLLVMPFHYKALKSKCAFCILTLKVSICRLRVNLYRQYQEAPLTFAFDCLSALSLYDCSLTRAVFVASLIIMREIERSI